MDTREDPAFFRKVTEVREALRGMPIGGPDDRGPGAMRRSPRAIFQAVWPPVVFGVGFLVLWEMAVKVFDFQPYFLPAPSAIWAEFQQNTTLIWDATKVSGLNALIGCWSGRCWACR